MQRLCVTLCGAVLDATVMESLELKARELIETLETSSVADYAASNDVSALATRLLLALPIPYNVPKVAYVMYATYLMQLYNTHFPVRKSAAVLSEEKDIPLVVLRHLLALFTDESQNDAGFATYLQPKALKDKLILYLLVVALTVNGFSLDLTEIAADLKKSPVVMTTYARQLGCGVDKAKADTAVYGTGAALAAKGKQVMRAVLTLPLQFPQPKRMVARR